MVSDNLLKQINLFKQKDEISKQILVDSHPTVAAELQIHVLKQHANIDALLLDAIRAYIIDTAFCGNYPEKAEDSDKLSIVLYASLSEVQYRKKVNILKLIYPSLRKIPTIASINELNAVRNEFAHTELRYLGTKYNMSDDRGAAEVLRVYEICDKAHRFLLEDMEKFHELTRYMVYQMKDTPGIKIDLVEDKE
jgi:hypothetical protein